MVDWAYVNGFGDEMGDPDHDIHDPEGHCGGGTYDWDHEDAGGPVNRPRCKFCGSTAVAWVHTGVRWRLYEEDMKRAHACQTSRVSADDFDDLTKA